MRNEANLRAALEARYVQLGQIASMFHPAYGMSINAHIQEAVDADLEYARVNPNFRRMLEQAIEKTALGAVLTVHAAMVAPIFTGTIGSRMRRGRTQPPPHSRPAAATPSGRPPRTPPQPPTPPTAGPRTTPAPPPPDGTPPTVVPDDASTLFDGMPGEVTSDGDGMDKPSNPLRMPGMPGL